jgi:Arc/MetJ-type ribon-helix-helix transcriptional regulator
MPGTAIVNVSFPRGLLRDIDQVAADEARSRSELLREATRMYIERRRRWKKLFGFWRAEAARRDVKPADVEHVLRRVRAK